MFFLTRYASSCFNSNLSAKTYKQSSANTCVTTDRMKLLLLVLSIAYCLADQQVRYAGNAVQIADPSGAVSWTSLTSIVGSSDTSFASTCKLFQVIQMIDYTSWLALKSGQYSQTIQASSFGFAIPPDASINGIQVIWSKSAETTGCMLIGCKLTF
jgi:hypothetical protein